MENAMLAMGKHIKAIRFKLRSLLGVYEGAKHDSEARIAKNKMADPINVKVCMFVQNS
jgi:hypothetical protein